MEILSNVWYIISIRYFFKLNTCFFYRWAATTQMQPTHARRVFPCFDEPKFKATFEVEIVRPQNFQPSVSNTPLSSSRPEG